MNFLESPVHVTCYHVTDIDLRSPLGSFLSERYSPSDIEEALNVDHADVIYVDARTSQDVWFFAGVWYKTNEAD